jgi:hypothetical protein
MKVYESQGPVLTPSPKGVNKKKEIPGEFQKIMDQIQVKWEQKAPVSNSGNLESILDGLKILPASAEIGQSATFAEREAVMKELKQSLDLIDFYASKLADSSIPITGMTPLINHLEARLGNLENLASAPSLPDKLGSIVSDAVITIGTEIAKFKRGDYSEG